MTPEFRLSSDQNKPAGLSELHTITRPRDRNTSRRCFPAQLWAEGLGERPSRGRRRRARRPSPSRTTSPTTQTTGGGRHSASNLFQRPSAAGFKPDINTTGRRFHRHQNKTDTSSCCRDDTITWITDGYEPQPRGRTRNHHPHTLEPSFSVGPEE